jgi:hypothetical protein
MFHFVAGVLNYCHNAQDENEFRSEVERSNYGALCPQSEYINAMRFRRMLEDMMNFTEHRVMERMGLKFQDCSLLSLKVILSTQIKVLETSTKCFITVNT